jgi:hypothetical protein
MSLLASLWGDVTDGNSINTAGFTSKLLSLTTFILILQKRRNADGKALFADAVLRGLLTSRTEAVSDVRKPVTVYSEKK